jgi:thiosulfate dehydrogenase
MRSMNGKRPVIDSKVNLVITAYITWLSTGMPVKMNEKVPCSPLNAKDG